VLAIVTNCFLIPPHVFVAAVGFEQRRQNPGHALIQRGRNCGRIPTGLVGYPADWPGIPTRLVDFNGRFNGHLCPALDAAVYPLYDWACPSMDAAVPATSTRRTATVASTIFVIL
jgi:hypothetical protein